MSVYREAGNGPPPPVRPLSRVRPQEQDYKNPMTPLVLVVATGIAALAGIGALNASGPSRERVCEDKGMQWVYEPSPSNMAKKAKHRQSICVGRTWDSPERAQELRERLQP